MKKRLLILFIVFLTLVLTALGCDKKIRDPNETLDFLKGLSSYSNDVTIEIKNDKQVINYTGKQFYVKDLGYRLEFGQDRVLIYKGNNIYVNDLKSSRKYVSDKNFDGMYKFTFVREYIEMLYTNENIKYTFKQIDGKEFMLVELEIPENNRNLNKAVLYLDRKTSLPEKLVIFDSKNREKVNVRYNNFRTDEEINKELFNN